MRLLAQSEKDLSVISAMVQDAITRVGDISYDKKTRQLIIAMNRFCWESGKRSIPARVRAALQISDVISVRQTGIASGKRNGILSVLAIEFTADAQNPPSGEIKINFSDNGTMLISVECLDLALVDISSAWGAKSRPKHG